MAEQNEIQLFDGKQVRYVWDEKQEKYFFSVVDVIQVLTDSPRPRKYWNALKTKLEAEGSELSSKMGQLKLPSSGLFGRMDQPAHQYHRDTQRLDRRMATRRDERGARLCHPDGYYLTGMERNDYARV